MSKLFLIICVPSTLLLGLACRDNSVTTPPPDPLGKRDYKWSIDSVYYGNLPSTIQVEVMWGSSATNIWGVAGDAPDVRDCLWHYDGIRWSRATDGTPITEFTGFKTVYGIWGSSANDIWTVGGKVKSGVLSAFLMHYDGSRWTDATPSNVSTLSAWMYRIYGHSKDDIWVGGYEYVLHFDGRTWSTYRVADSLTVNGVAGKDSHVFFQVASPWGKQEVYLYSFNREDTSFAIIDRTTIQEEKFGGAPWIVGTDFYSLAGGIFHTTVSSLGVVDTAAWTKRVATTSYPTQRYIASEKDMFVVGQFNLINHYNGHDWSPITITVDGHGVDPISMFWGVWADGSEVHICDVQNGLMYHGK